MMRLPEGIEQVIMNKLDATQLTGGIGERCGVDVPLRVMELNTPKDFISKAPQRLLRTRTFVLADHLQPRRCRGSLSSR